MWLVRIALRRPYTFVVMALLIVLVGGLSIVRMPTDIFPDIDIPVISVIWNYTGLTPAEMERRIVTNSERTLTTTVNDIEHVESQSLTGIALCVLRGEIRGAVDRERIFLCPGEGDGLADGARRPGRR